MRFQRHFRSFSTVGLPFVACLWLIAFTALAAPVTPERAQSVAANWMLDQTGIEHKALLDLYWSGAGEAAAQSTAAYYVLNMHPNGWVIVAADDLAYPIIGYSPEGTVYHDDAPPAFKAWMQMVDESIRLAVQGDPVVLAAESIAAQDTADLIADAWQALEVPNFEPTPRSTDDVSEGALGAMLPLITTTWSQDTYYNQFCPVDSAGPGGRALVGCCATAMGQILRYHAQPAVGQGAHSYYHSRYGTLSANFGATSYNWAAMPSTGLLSYYNSAVATLLSHVGIAVDMDYGTDSSNCYPDRIAPALRNYFKYFAEDLAARSSYSDAAWVGKLKADLDARRPILYAGYGSGGHAFVLDGYTDANYFHFNWGWNGAYDGYFLLSNLNPGGYSFTNSQLGIFGIRPAGTVPPPPPPAATLISPNGATGTPTPTYTWNAVSNSSWYYLWVDDTTSGGQGKIKTWYTAASAGCPSGSGTCSVTPSTAITRGDATWWIQTWNESGEGPWSAPMGFIVGTPPRAASLVSPSGTTITDNTPTYNWRAVQDSTWYYLWVDDPSSGGNGKIKTWYTAAEVGCANGVGTCSATPTTALVNGRETWWIQTWNDFGDGPWSTERSFTVNARPPGPATLISPSGLIRTPAPTYSWNAVSDSSWYNLWVDDTTSGGQGKITIWYTAAQAGCGNGRGICSVTPSIGLANGNATWWIQTWNNDGEGPWSAEMNFAIQAGP